MFIPAELATFSKQTESLLGNPFEWCPVTGGPVTLLDARDYGGTVGGIYQVADFVIAKYLLTNAQYKKFIEHSSGFSNSHWWDFSPQGKQHHPLFKSVISA